MTTVKQRSNVDAETQALSSLSTAAARNLATTTKTVPQMQEITSRWLLRVLPWVEVTGGAYRVNRRLSYAIGDGRLSFSNIGSEIRVVPPELCELPQLRGFSEMEVFEAIAQRFTQHEFAAGEVIVSAGQAADRLYLIAHGKADRVGAGRYGGEAVLGVLADGDFFGDQVLLSGDLTWDYTVRAATRCIVLTLSRQHFAELAENSEALHAQLRQWQGSRIPKQNKHGEAEIALAAGHDGEPRLPGTFVDYEFSPREYELVNNRGFGLLHNADLKQRIHTRSGPPTPDDMDELLSRRRSTHVLLAHPGAIAALGRECSSRGIYPPSVDYQGHNVPSWRGVPLLPCSKIPVTETHTTSVIAMRLGEDDQGVVGPHQTGLPDEYELGLSVRFMGINEQAVISYLVSVYFCAAVLVPDALGVLENVELGHYAS